MSFEGVANVKEMEARLARQVRVSKMLGLGFVFSVAPYAAVKVSLLAGLSSLVSLLIGVKALGIIRQSKKELDGMEMALWCIVVGAIGAVIFPLLYLLVGRFPHL